MKTSYSVRFVAAFIKRYGMTPYMETRGYISRLCGCVPTHPCPVSDIVSVKRSYSYVKRVFYLL